MNQTLAHPGINSVEPIYSSGYEVTNAIQAAGICAQEKARPLAVKAVLASKELTEEERKELVSLEAAFDDHIENDADHALMRLVVHDYIMAVAGEKGIRLSAKSVAEGMETFLGFSGYKAPAYARIRRAFGLVKGIVRETEMARLTACFDSSIGAERAPRGGELADLGLFE